MLLLLHLLSFLIERRDDFRRGEDVVRAVHAEGDREAVHGVVVPLQPSAPGDRDASRKQPFTLTILQQPSVDEVQSAGIFRKQQQQLHILHQRLEETADRGE
jgi:hypothetical protein